MNSSFGRGSVRGWPIGRIVLCLLQRLSIVNSTTTDRMRNSGYQGETCMFSRRTAIFLIAAQLITICASAIASMSPSSALDYPTRPVRFVVGFPPGGAPAILARLIGQRLSERLGQQFTIKTNPGAGTNIGPHALVNAAPADYPRLFVAP